MDDTQKQKQDAKKAAKAAYMREYRAKNKVPIEKPEITEIDLDLEPAKYKPKRAKNMP